MRPLKYFYCGFYHLMMQWWGRFDDDPWVEAWMMFSSTLYMNLRLLIIILAWGFEFTWQPGEGTAIVLGCVGAMYIYFGLGSRIGMKAIVLGQLTQSPTYTKWQARLALLYFGLSFLLGLAAMIFLSGRQS